MNIKIYQILKLLPKKKKVEITSEIENKNNKLNILKYLEEINKDNLHFSKKKKL